MNNDTIVNAVEEHEIFGDRILPSWVNPRNPVSFPDISYLNQNHLRKRVS